jgi:hypothetical protein
MSLLRSPRIIQKQSVADMYQHISLMRRKELSSFAQRHFLRLHHFSPMKQKDLLSSKPPILTHQYTSYCHPDPLPVTILSIPLDGLSRNFETKYLYYFIYLMYQPTPSISNVTIPIISCTTLFIINISTY